MFYYFSYFLTNVASNSNKISTTYKNDQFLNLKSNFLVFNITYTVIKRSLSESFKWSGSSFPSSFLCVESLNILFEFISQYLKIRLH